MAALSEEYDAMFLIPCLASCRGIFDNTTEESQEFGTEESSGIFWEGAADDGPLEAVRWEVGRFRREKYLMAKETLPASAKDSPKWLRDHSDTFPGSLALRTRFWVSLRRRLTTNDRLASPVCCARFCGTS